MDANVVLQEWLDRSGEFSPSYYAYYGPDETSESIRGVLNSAVGRDASVLELGCSSGRHLAHLHDGGYRNLSGIEINPDAFDVMTEEYPDLAAAGTFYFDAIENVVTEFEDEQFDAVYSVETLQHIHHDNEWVFEEVARITAEVLVTVEIEGDAVRHPSTEQGVSYVDEGLPLYYRNWNAAFSAFGFSEVESATIGKETLRVFRRTAG